MSREILYKKDSIQEAKSNEKVTESISSWLKNHPLINISGLCRMAAINRANFDKYLKMKEIPKKHETTLINILKNYGYGK